MRWFFDENIVPGSKLHLLEEEESIHILRVLRMQQGDTLVVVNGKGDFFEAKVIGKEGKRCAVEVLTEIHYEKLPYSIHIAIAPTKQMERIEWFIEKATEIGVSEITIIQSKNSERTKIKIDRLIKKAISALKQSRQYYLPVLTGPIEVDQFIQSNPNGLIAHCYEGEKFSIRSKWNFQKCPILIGPEGDFTMEELQLAQQNGYKSVTLGENRLRTETAGIYACMQAKLICDEK